MQFTVQESKYNFFYIKWISIKYDRESCIKFVEEYKTALKSKDKKLIQLFHELIKLVGEKHIQNLCNGDFDTCRVASIEKYARECAMDILLYGQYTKDTYKIISHLPLDDYKLILKRSQELINFFKDIKIEEETKESNVPGV